VSLMVAILASYTALDLATRITASQGSAARSWLIGGACSMGLGIFSMHFVGMLAFSLPIPMGYDVPTTLLSMVIAIVVSGLALYIVSRDRLGVRNLLGGGILMGLGICSMHYSGMEAMQMQPHITYDAPLFAASVAIAIAASFAALFIAFTLRDGCGWKKFAKLGSAVVMGRHYRHALYGDGGCPVLAGCSVSYRAAGRQLLDGRNTGRHHIPDPVHDLAVVLDRCTDGDPHGDHGGLAPASERRTSATGAA